MAEFGSDQEVLAATRAAYDRGYRKMDALFAPFAIARLAEILGRTETVVPVIVFAAGAFGCLGGYFLQWYAMVVSFPLNAGGRPLNSWPVFIPTTFELTILSAAIVAVIGMLALNKLPLPYHPLLNVPRFERASSDKFFLCIQANDPKFDLKETWRFLEMLQPESIAEVPNE